MIYLPVSCLDKKSFTDAEKAAKVFTKAFINDESVFSEWKTNGEERKVTFKTWIRNGVKLLALNFPSESSDSRSTNRVGGRKKKNKDNVGKYIIRFME